MLNKVLLLGRMVADPELRQTPSAVSVCSFTIAVDRPYVKGGERQTDFIDCVAWRNTAEFLCRYFQKGKPILVEGRIQTRTYTDKNDQKRKAVEVQVDNVNFVEGTKPTGNAEPASVPNGNAGTGVAFATGDAGDFQEVDGFDDLPF